VLAEMEAFGFRGEGIVLSNPIDTRTFRPLPRRKAAKARYGFTDATAIYAGRLAHEKHIDVLLRAVARARSEVPRLMLALAGGGPEERPLRTLAARLGILSAVRFLGILDKPALAEAYNASELFTITSTSETQSLTMMQALSCGLPVVAVRARALPEYINRRNGVLVPPGDAALLAREIVRLIKHPQARKTLGMGARKSAQAFSPPHIAEAWERLYQRAIGAHRHS
ncbi:MAG: glycosyltransferase, partial [Candidatus Liptonbacteria bacterium]|nr:glycosyltransferase [Candidatus Liptonbacteria bacterium]